MERSALFLVLIGVVALLATILGFQCFESNSITDILVVQSLSGDVTIYTDPGIKTVGFGSITIYPKREEYAFGKGEGSDTGPIQVRFNDNAHAQISGAVSWEMPLDQDSIREIHTKFGSEEAVTTQVVAKALSNAMYMTGPLMSSTESSSARRAELLHRIDDQMQYGIYTTDVRDEKTVDPLSGETKTVKVVRLRESTQPDDHGYERQEESPVEEFSIRTFNLGLTEIEYDSDVQAQLREQQQATAKVQSAMADAKKAEQDAITAELHGKALVAQAKAEQDAANAKDIALAEMRKKVATTDAEMRKAVAAMDAEAALHEKAKQVALGEGEAARRKLVMEADGALERKLTAWVEINKAYANALGSIRLPTVTMGGAAGDSATAPSAVADLMNLLMAKTAKDLAVEVGTEKK